MNRYYCVQLSKLTESKNPVFALVLLSSIVKLSMCDAFWLAPKAMTKLRTIFQLTKFFREKIYFFVIFSIFGASFPKASAKLGIIFELTKYFRNFFMLKNIKNFFTADYQAVTATFF